MSAGEQEKAETAVEAKERNLLSVAEAAAELNVTRARVNQLIDGGVLIAQRIGRAFVISRDELEKAKRRNQSPGRPRSAK